MRKVAGVLILLALLVGCGPPPPTEGQVIQRRFVPAHWEAGYRTESYTDCGMHYDVGEGEYTYSCRPETRQVYESHHQFIHDAWQLRLEQCEADKDECNRGWLDVDRDDYRRFQVGQHYPNPA